MTGLASEAEAGSFRAVIPLEAAQMEGRSLRVAVNTTPESGTGGTTQNRQGWVFAPPATFIPVHDLDGNLVEEARWVYTWDAEPSRGTEPR